MRSQVVIVATLVLNGALFALNLDVALLSGSRAVLAQAIYSVTDLVGRLAQAEIRLAERTAADFKELRDLQANTEYKLNALIATVDKLVRRDGQQGMIPPSS